jgi:two-component system cell cycle sensor histidine kinase/response regulator CckA
LAIVYGIVRQCGGTVTVDSTLGAGTAFHVFLPRMDHAGDAPQEDKRPAIVRGTGVILVVDDEPALGAITQRILQRAGYTVHLARSGEEAVRLADSLPGTLDLLLSDVIMPEMSGPDVASALRARDPALRVMFVSGHSGDILINYGVQERDYAFMAKPFSIPDLTQKVKDVLTG